jgi:DNA-binding transcriptional ArsR family regulator
MAGPDEIIHQSTRLRLMAALNALPEGEHLDFVELKAVIQSTDGNLGTHLGVLEKAGYVVIEKDFVGRKPRTRVALSRPGRRAFAGHVAYLRELIDGG